MLQLPYSFAKRHQILVMLAIDPELPPTLLLTKATSLSAINEAVRFYSSKACALYQLTKVSTRTTLKGV